MNITEELYCALKALLEDVKSYPSAARPTPEFVEHVRAAQVATLRYEGETDQADLIEERIPEDRRFQPTRSAAVHPAERISDIANRY